MLPHVSTAQPFSDKGRSESAETDEHTPLAREFSSFSMSQACTPAWADCSEIYQNITVPTEFRPHNGGCASGGQSGDQ